MNEERVMILQMVKDGKISLEEADRLLEALNKTERAHAQSAQGGGTQPANGPVNLNNLGVQIGRMLRDEINRAVGDPQHASQTVRQAVHSLKSIAHEIKGEVKSAMREAKMEIKRPELSRPCPPTPPTPPAWSKRAASELEEEIEECFDELRDGMQEVESQLEEMDDAWREYNEADHEDRPDMIGELRSSVSSLYSTCAETTKLAGDLANLVANSGDSDRKMADELIGWANKAVERAMKRGKEIEALVDEMATLERMEQTKGLDDLQNPPTGR